MDSEVVDRRTRAWSETVNVARDSTEMVRNMQSGEMQADNLVSERNFQWKLEDKRKVLSDVEALRIEQEMSKSSSRESSSETLSIDIVEEVNVNKRWMLKFKYQIKLATMMLKLCYQNWTKASDDDDSSVDLTYQEAKHHG